MNSAQNRHAGLNEVQVVDPYKYMEENKNLSSRPMRQHQLASKVIDLTHDTLPEYSWKPIRKQYDRLPPQPIMDDKVLLLEWEMEQRIDYYNKIYDRREIDVDVFKRFMANGEIIKMTIDPSELTKDKKFWQSENEIQDKAVDYINKFKRMRPYDIHKLHPQTYDLKMIGDPNSGGAKKRS